VAVELPKILHYDIVEKKYKISSHTIEILEVKDINTLLDGMDSEEFNIDERLPYWAEVWPSSIGLAEVLCRWNVNGKKMLELGCGVGLVGIAAVLEGAIVKMTDYEEDALTFSKINIQKNLKMTGYKKYPEVALLDWRKPSLDSKFDMIVGSDLIYETRNHKPILELINKYLLDSGVAIMSDPNRSTLNSFIELVWTNNFSLEVEKSRVAFYEKHFDISLLVLKKKWKK
jgi:predicted nicotinamide N-methyase